MFKRIYTMGITCTRFNYTVTTDDNHTIIVGILVLLISKGVNTIC